MSDENDQRDSVKPTQQRGGTIPSEREAQEKGPWAAKAAEGVVPAASASTSSATGPQVRPWHAPMPQRV